MVRKKKISKRASEKPVKDWFRLSLTILTFLTLFFLPGQNVYQKPLTLKNQVLAKVEFPVPTPALYPVNFTHFYPQDLTAQGVLVVDLPSGIILFQKNPHLQLPPASTTKIMTALVVLEHFPLDQVLTVKTVIQEGRVMGLLANEKMTVENLLYGTLVHSANDAAYALAENYPGGVKNFVKKMNEKDSQIGLKNTHFENPIGFESINHYTTPLDLFHLTAYALQNKIFTKIVGIPSITVHDQEFQHFHYLENVNELLGKIPGVAGIKTGFTENAGQCLVNLTKRNGREILTIVLKSEDRFGETERLLDWVFLNYRWEEIIPTIRL